MAVSEKVFTIGTIVVVIAGVAIAIWAAMQEFRYIFGSVTTDATIISVAPEFAGYSHDEVDGTQPKIRYRISYSFDTLEGTQVGETTIASGFAAGADSLPVQYLNGNPAQHRIMTPSLKIMRFFIFATLFLFASYCTYRLVEKRGKFST